MPMRRMQAVHHAVVWPVAKALNQQRRLSRRLLVRLRQAGFGVQ